MNPDNVNASIRRRQLLVDALDTLDGDQLADLIEAVERVVGARISVLTLGWSHQQSMRQVIRALYEHAGLTDDEGSS
jgi:hypothetical protein